VRVEVTSLRPWLWRRVQCGFVGGSVRAPIDSENAVRSKPTTPNDRDRFMKCLSEWCPEQSSNLARHPGRSCDSLQGTSPQFGVSTYTSVGSSGYRPKCSP